MAEAIHVWFSLSYANYLVLPRTLLQSMPDEWQDRFVSCLKELQRATADIPQASDYWVRARKDNKFIADPVPHYNNRGRTRLALDGREPK